jgi:sugar O-acyltransferase (sialic acid O-acetyltransferase NeuD family)
LITKLLPLRIDSEGQLLRDQRGDEVTAGKPLLLLGAGGLAREVLAAVRALGDEWNVLGALDDDPAKHGLDLDGVPVLGPTSLVHDHADAFAVACVVSPRNRSARSQLVGRLGMPVSRWATIVHPAATVPAGTDLGEGTVLLAATVVTAPQRIGRHVLAMPHVLITHDDEIGDFVTLAGRAALAGGVRIGAGAYVGAGALVREGVRIGPGAMVGMGAVVLTDVPDGQTWAGVPARELARRDS